MLLPQLQALFSKIYLPGFALLTAFLALISAEPLRADFMIEPATGSLWLSEGSGILGGSVLGEWRRDGSFAAMPDPFSPFGRSHKGLYRGIGPMMIGPEFYIGSNLQVFYHRGAQGHWEALPSTAFLPNDVRCERRLDSGKKGCWLFAGSEDSRGVQEFIAFGSDRIDDSATRRFYSSPQGLRQAQGVEVFFGKDDSADKTYWLDADHAVVMADSSNQKVNYAVITPAGRREQNVMLPSAPTTNMGDAAAFAAEGKLYVMQRAIDQMSGRYVTTIYRIDGVLSLAPQLSLIANLIDTELNSYDLEERTAVGGHVLYYSPRSSYDRSSSAPRLRALDLETKRVTDLSGCEAERTGIKVLANNTQPLAQRRPWMACGRYLLELADGGVRRTLVAAGPVESGKVLARDGERTELVVELVEKKYQHFLPDGSSQQLDLGGLDGAPQLYPAWEEQGVICGVAKASGKDLAQVYCQRGGGWTPKAEGPVPYEVLHVEGRSWALAREGNQTSVYCLEDQTGAAWHLVQSWPPLSADQPRLDQARLLRQGTTAAAVDFGTPEIWVLQGNSFVAAYPHPRGRLPLRPAIANDGLLYDACTLIEEGGAEYPKLCWFDAAGHCGVVALGLPDYGELVPLKEGVFYGGSFSGRSYSDRPQILRGGRAIELSHLYGQISSKEAFSYRDVGAGTVMMGTANYVNANAEVKAFLYDGKVLSRVDTSGEALFGFNFYSSGTVPYPAGTPPTVQSSSPAIGQAWRGLDGLWRRSDSARDAAKGDGYHLFRSAFAASFTPGSSLHRNVSSAGVVWAGQVWSAGEGGLYTCALNSATPLGASVFELTATPGCRLRLPLPWAQDLRVVSGQIVAKQGDRIVLIRPGDAADGSGDEVVEVGSGSGALGVEDGGAKGLVSWVSEGSLHTLHLPEGSSSTTTLPEAVDGAMVKALSPRWLCTSKGLYSLGADGVWQAVPAVASCKSMANGGLDVLATDGHSAFVCREGRCGEGLALPESYLDDTVLGTLKPHDGATVFAWISGDHLYSLDKSVFTLDTPSYAGGSALLTRTSSCVDGVMGLLGGGVIVQEHAAGGEGGWSHLRLE